MSDVKLTVAQAAQELGESVHIVRNWLKDFRSYIPSEKSGNGYNLFTQDAIDVLRRIQKMFREQNLSTKQIEAILSGADRPTIKTDEQAAAAESFGAVKELLDEQRLFNSELLKRLDDQHQQFEKFVQRRDEQIMFVLRELQETREQRQLENKQKSWWKRWFKGG